MNARDVIRLFVAVYPPPEMARALLATLGSLDIPDHRPTPLEQVHLTLHFIGDTSKSELEGVAESVTRAASGLEPFLLRAQRIVTMPRPAAARGKRPRIWPKLIAVQTDAPPALLEIQRRLAVRLARPSRPNAGDRFSPHITLCRFPPSATPQAIDLALAEGSAATAAFEVGAIGLMRSMLRPEGALHAEVASVNLGVR